MDENSEADNDYRYSIKVTLLREDRPKYWEFHCNKCMAKIIEIDGNIARLQDVSHDVGLNRPALRAKCPGTKRDFCRLWYEFQFY